MEEKEETRKRVTEVRIPYAEGRRNRNIERERERDRVEERNTGDKKVEKESIFTEPI